MMPSSCARVASMWSTSASYINAAIAPATAAPVLMSPCASTPCFVFELLVVVMALARFAKFGFTSACVLARLTGALTRNIRMMSLMSWFASKSSKPPPPPAPPAIAPACPTALVTGCRMRPGEPPRLRLDKSAKRLRSNGNRLPPNRLASALSSGPATSGYLKASSVVVVCETLGLVKRKGV